MGIMSIVKSVIEHFRKAGKTEKEISSMIEQAADKATVNKGITEKKEYKKPEIKAKTTAEQFVEAVMQTGVTAEQVKTATPLMEDVPVYETKTNPDTGEKERVQVGTRQVVNGERERLMVIQDRCMKQCRQGASDFGLTVSSRCRLVVPKPQQQKPENKFAKYAN